MSHERPPSLRVRVRTLLLVVAGTAVLLSVPNCLTTAWQTLQDATSYAPGYSERSFRSIRMGMHESIVIRVLGEPLRTHSSVPQTSLYDSPPSLRVSDDGGLWDASGTFDTGRGYTLVSANQ